MLRVWQLPWLLLLNRQQAQPCLMNNFENEF
jgi:hypothetical protein